jgi:tRNA threonylcarbamoyladenosine biosynthesis protein TsaE
MIISYTLDRISTVAKMIIPKTKRTICLYGNLGSGKTTLVKSIIQELGMTDSGYSPTFGIVNEYLGSKGDVLAYHIDCYRLESEEEALDIGIEEYLASKAWVFIEWPERIQSLLPNERSEIRLEFLDETTRKLSLQNLP